MISPGGRVIRYVVTTFMLVTGVLLSQIATTASAQPSPTLQLAPSLTRGFADDVWFTGTPTVNAQWINRTVATDATRVLVEVDWTSVEPTAPQPPNDPTSPSDPQYRFSSLDARVREFVGTGLIP